LVDHALQLDTNTQRQQKPGRVAAK